MTRIHFLIRRLARFDMLASLALAVLLLGVVTAARAADKVTVGVLRFVSSGPLFLAVERGYFKDQGIEVDLKYFEAADKFRWNSKARRMLSFGVGPHFCIGIHLARLEGRILIEEFLSAVKAYEPLTDKGNFAESEFQIGWTSLPVRVAV